MDSVYDFVRKRIDPSRTIKKIYEVGKDVYVVAAINENNFSKGGSNYFLVMPNETKIINPAFNIAEFNKLLKNGEVIYDV